MTVKIQGLGRRQKGTTHADCIRVHRESYSKQGMAMADDLCRYVLLYFQQAFTPDGRELEDFSWDIGAFEWYKSQEAWGRFQAKLKASLNGQGAPDKEREGFLDLDHCYLNPYDEKLFVAGEPEDSVNLIRVLTAKDGLSAQPLADAHERTCAPAIRAQFGDAIKKYAGEYLIESLRMAEGVLPKKPFDIIEYYKFDPSWKGREGELVKSFTAPAIRDAEASLFVSDATVTMTAEEVRYIA